MLVKKYANRRLYDTESSRYVTLEELAEKIRVGADARVVDAASGEDLTQSTLAQIILESRGAARLLPIGLLTQLIRMGDDALAEFMGRYLSSALELYLSARQGAMAMAPYNPFANAPFAATNALARLMMGGAVGPSAGFGGFGGLGGLGWPEPAPPPVAAAPPPSPPPSSPRSRDEADEDVRALRRELEELKLSLRGAAAPPRKAKRAAADRAPNKK